MLDNPLLNVCIGLVFFYLLLSIITTTGQELIANWRNWRGKNLKRALDELIKEPSVREGFFRHEKIFPLFQGPCKDNPSDWCSVKRLPSFIPPRDFAEAVRDLVHDLQLKANNQPQNITAEQSGAAVALCHRLTANAQDPVPAVEALFNQTMDRATGWYKRQAQNLSLAIGFVVAVLLNADSIHVASQLWSNKALQDGLVKAADGFSASASDAVKSECASAESQVCSDSIAKLGSQLRTLADASFPIGWTKAVPADQRKASGEVKSSTFNPAAAPTNPSPSADSMASQSWPSWMLPYHLQPGQSWLSAIAGMVLTSLAISLGNNFWFDLLEKFIRFRSGGNKKE
jgi:hypothetical protein